ncbi:hypothetical protein [Flavobacterium sp. Root420]|uniref:hypothetical protein n=1 Tax=Flavobacterium sp. Root420 TaxID=1736533 RepID=UPI0006FF0AEC|nr:hypothetical protein [Flavobacterium sp. Root420]KQX02891.1 hypothetical protein ASC72_23085 [Flavobacterium sp. Root420]
MIKNLILLFFLFFNAICFGQEYPEKEKKYDLDIFEFLMNTTEKDSVSYENFLINTKPFSKWDIRPLKREKVWALDTIHLASEVPNFIFGAFSKKYGVSQKDAMNMPNQFLEKGRNQKNILENYLNENLKKFDNLSKLISKNPADFFLIQDKLQRVGNLFKENGTFWKYTLPEDSPFPISNAINTNTKDHFTKEQIKTLELLLELKIYSAFKTKNGIFYLVDGFTDNSYGFYFNSEGKIETDNFLFEVMKYEKITENYFYYIAN